MTPRLPFFLLALSHGCFNLLLAQTFKIRDSPPSTWDYHLDSPPDCAGTIDDRCGPYYWMNAQVQGTNMCDGLNQSPINIKTSLQDTLDSIMNQLNNLVDSYISGGGIGTSSTPKTALEFPNPTSGGCNGWTQFIDNQGYKISFVEGNDTKYLCNRLALSFKQSTYVLKRLEFKSPSEHSIDGNTFDAEIQFHHESFDHQKLVLTVLANAITSKFRYISQYQLQVLYQAAATKVRGISYKAPQPTDILYNLQIKNPFVINFYKSFLPKSRSFYAYEGSLTSPPCTEKVQWLVMKDSIDLSVDEIMFLRKAVSLYPNSLIDEYGDNKRPIQELNGRNVTAYM